MKMLPLLRRTDLLPRESLPSLIERLTLLNYYQGPGIIGSICHQRNGSQGSFYSTIRPQNIQFFSQLANLTMLKAELLFDASDHFFASILNPPWQAKAVMRWTGEHVKQMLANSAKRWIRPFYSAQFCPLCISEMDYHRISWVPVASCICLIHKCLLENRCPKCYMDVSVSEIVKRQCRMCKTDLRKARPVSVADDKRGILSQQLMQSWLSIANVPPNNHRYPRPCSRMYHIWERLAMGLLFCQKDWHSLPMPLSGLCYQVKRELNPYNKMAPFYAYYLYRKAFEGIRNWPYGFFNFLDAYGQRNDRVRHNPNMVPRFGGLGQWFRSIWHHQDFKFLKQILIQYLSSRNLSIPRISR